MWNTEWEDLEDFLKAFIQTGEKRIDMETDCFKYKTYWVADYIRIDAHPKVDP